ncbi:MAG TPA: FAD-dependent thymidylate synthase [Pelolinea sp.]|nr:FAD-dependent thymidylate synthase [Pelolinea sp.]
MPQPRRIYLLDPKQLSPETIAVAFAKTSRSPQSFEEIASELSEKKSADFHEKWVVGYGHSSVAEHAVLHVAIENISRLAVECLESNRLASYTEKSSRYQVWEREHFHIPQELLGHPLESEYIRCCQLLFDHYQLALGKVTEYLKRQHPIRENESERTYQQHLKSAAADACRYFLPAGSLANVGMTINARALEHAIIKMLSHPLMEVREIGREIKAVSQKNVPTLVKYAYENVYLKFFEDSYPPNFGINSKKQSVDSSDWFTCVDCYEKGEDLILAALLYRFDQMPFAIALSTIQRLPEPEKKKLAGDLLGRLGDHDIPLRELEYAGISIDILMDQGAYFEFKRHRMMTQTPQILSALNGFAMPSLLVDAGYGEQFKQDMEEISGFYAELQRFFPQAASYIVPNAFNRRVLVQMNLRSALHFIKLRSAPNAHFAIRRVALRMLQEVSDRFPLFTRYFQSITQETVESVENTFFKKLI